MCGKASYNLKNRMKVLALARKKHPITGQDSLSTKEEIANCKAYIKLCEMDIEKIGKSIVICNKIKGYVEDIKKLEARLKNEEIN